MKRCPFCAEEIRDEAVKCRYCGEWLTDRTPSDQLPPPTIVSRIDVVEPVAEPISKPNEVAEVLNTVELNGNVTIPASHEPAKSDWSKTLLYAFLLALAAMLGDMLFGVFVALLTTVPDEWFLRALLGALYISLGLFAADFFYRLRQPFTAIAVSIGLLIAFRIGFFFLVTNTVFGDYVKSRSDPNLLTTILTNTVLEVGFVFLPLVAWGWLLKRAEPRLNFTTLSDVRKDLKGTEGKKFDNGTCGKCDKTTVIAVEGFTGFLGKRQRYFCQHCHTFLRGNPLKAMVDGFAGAVISFVFLFGFLLVYPDGGTSTAHSVLGAILIVGVFAGLKKTGASGYAFLKSYRSSA